MADTHIQWTQRVWNSTTGCDKVSPGCGLPRPDSDDEETGNIGGCYALAMAKRLKGMGQPKYQRDGNPRTSGPGFGLTVHEDVLTDPLRWRKPSKVFVNSMSDLFHAGVPDEHIAKVFAVMAATPHHTYQILSKRHARMRSLLSRGTLGTEGFPDMVEEAMAEYTHASLDEWPLRNVHLGVSVENQHWADIRIPELLATPAAVRWISAEPLIGPLDLTNVDWNGSTGLTILEHWPNSIDWVVVGGESGPGARPLEEEWVRSLVQQCKEAHVPIFVKQMGSVWASETRIDGQTVRSLGDPKGGDMQWWPSDLRVRQFPEPAGVIA